MYGIIGCAAKDSGLESFLLLNPMGAPVYVAGQFWDVLEHLLSVGIDEVVLFTANRPTLVRIKNNLKGFEERDEAPFLLVRLVGIDPSEVPPMPELYRLPAPDLS